MIKARPMRPSELFEHADAYVLDLLEPEERDAFELGLANASSDVRSQIDNHIRRVSLGLETVLPDVHPDPSLRFRIFASIREAMSDHTAGSSQGSWWSSTAFWRAACLGFATAAVTLGGFGFAMQRQHDGLERSIQASIVSKESQRLGPVFARVMFADDRQEIDLTPAATLPVRSGARLLVDPSTGAAVLLAMDMPVNEGTYTIELHSEDGTTQRLASFVGTPGLNPVTIAKLDLDAGGELVVVGPSSEDTPAEVLFRVQLA